MSIMPLEVRFPFVKKRGNMKSISRKAALSLRAGIFPAHRKLWTFRPCFPFMETNHKLRPAVNHFSRLHICAFVFEDFSCNIEAETYAFDIGIALSPVKALKKKRILVLGNCCFAYVPDNETDITGQFRYLDFNLCAGFSVFYRIVQNIKKSFRRPFGIYERQSLRLA